MAVESRSNAHSIIHLAWHWGFRLPLISYYWKKRSVIRCRFILMLLSSLLFVVDVTWRKLLMRRVLNESDWYM